MEPEPLKPAEPENLMDKIAADPEIINRSAAEVGAEVPMVASNIPDVRAVVAEGTVTKMDGHSEFGAPVFNLLAPKEGAPPTVAAGAAAGGAAGSTKSARKLWLSVAAGALVVMAGGGGYYFYAQSNAKPKVAVVTPTPVASASPTASPTPDPTPTPTPVPIPAASNVTAPSAVPTSDRPQAVTVKSKSGLWLRSSANSSSKNNIIGWIPFGGTVSVDAVGDFWWHGVYKGKSGYFASNYTN